MIPKYRAYDSGSLCRMYRPEEVWVCDGGIWVIDEDSWNGGLISNNDLNLMQSTGFTDKDGKCIFRRDIIAAETGLFAGVIGIDQDLGAYVVRFIGYKHFKRLRDVASSVVVIGNLYENPELLEVRT